MQRVDLTDTTIHEVLGIPQCSSDLLFRNHGIVIQRGWVGLCKEAKKEVTLG
jgi:hypothetical protein